MAGATTWLPGLVQPGIERPGHKGAPSGTRATPAATSSGRLGRLRHTALGKAAGHRTAHGLTTSVEDLNATSAVPSVVNTLRK